MISTTAIALPVATAPLHLRIIAPSEFEQRVAERAAIIQHNLPKLPAETAWQIAVWHVEAQDDLSTHTPGEDVDSWLRSFDGYNGGER